MLVRYLAMVADRSDPQPLEYAARAQRGRITRGVIVALIGAGIALIGTVFFACAHKFADRSGVYEQHIMLHELLWAAFGIALLLSGALIATVGLRSWCRGEAGFAKNPNRQ